MGVTKEILREGDGTNFPKKGDKLSMHYKGTLASNGTQVSTYGNIRKQRSQVMSAIPKNKLTLYYYL